MKDLVVLQLYVFFSKEQRHFNTLEVFTHPLDFSTKRLTQHLMSEAYADHLNITVIIFYVSSEFH